MKMLLLALVGAVVGAIVVRAFMLDTVEEVAFRVFWTGIQEGEKVFTLDAILESKSFMKIAGGAGVGLILGGILGGMMGKKK